MLLKNVYPLSIESHGDIPDWAYSAARSILESLRLVDPITYAHCLRVGDAAKKFSKSLGLTEYQQKLAQFSGLLHDVGKMGVPAAIVHKPGKLDASEMDIMMTHVDLSLKIISPLTHHDFFAQVFPAVESHHERVDGDGYPYRNIGSEIPFLARVLAIVDTLDAMGQDRSYRKGLPIDIIYKEIKRCSGTQFDADLAKIFLESHPHWNKERISYFPFTQIEGSPIELHPVELLKSDLKKKPSSAA